MYTYFDAHCDTMSKMYKKRIGLDSPDLMVNTNNLHRYKSATQVFALFNNGEMNKENMMNCFEYFKNECKKLPSMVSVCSSAKEIDENTAPLSAILAVEGLGNQPDFSVDDVNDFYNIGVRFMSLCWNSDNILCGGCEGENTGITDLGRQTLAQMEKHRIILDVSHMSDKSFWESFENYSLPICATHSVSRSVHNHKRNLTDEQFIAIKNKGGVCGINFYPPFLCDGKADINTVIKHIEHFMSLGGENSIGLGSDFDGIGVAPEDLENSADICNLLDRLLALNYSEETVEKIAFKNFKNLFKQFTE
ncbi:MAG: membrane dipeptidase [Clostridia bacterium]|nr:membrane dipeptidase [Clostridia bacterium]